jgi:hypothetical protein
MHYPCALSEFEMVTKHGLVGTEEVALMAGMFIACNREDLPRGKPKNSWVYLLFASLCHDLVNKPLPSSPPPTFIQLTTSYKHVYAERVGGRAISANESVPKYDRG